MATGRARVGRRGTPALVLGACCVVAALAFGSAAAVPVLLLAASGWLITLAGRASGPRPEAEPVARNTSSAPSSCVVVRHLGETAKRRD